jgi:voltage-gated potassium channel
MAADGKMSRHVQLLTALVVTELVNPLMADVNPVARLFSALLFGILGVAVFRAIFDTKIRRRIGATLACTAIAINIMRLSVPAGMKLPADLAFNISTVAFFAFCLYVIVNHVFGARNLRADDVVGAFSGYIIIALIWGRLYALAWMIVPGSFSISSDIRWQLANWHTFQALFDYYSFTTISSIGYGNITTTGPLSNTLVWLEVMCGQFYLAVVVATIVGIKVAQALASPRDGG